MGVSERMYHYMSAFNRYAAFQWSNDIIDGKYGRGDGVQG
jgi:hypothetical protein